MTKETFIIIFKAVLTVGGSYLLGINLWGQIVDNSILQIIIGIALSGASIAWSIFDKSYTIESIQAFIRQTVLFVGGLLIAAGKITPERLDVYLGAILAIIPVLQSYLSKKKAQDLKEGELQVNRLKSIPNLPKR